LPLSTRIGVGDSHSDVPRFGSMEFSVAWNGTADATAAASVSVNAETLIDIFAVVPGL